MRLVEVQIIRKFIGDIFGEIPFSEFREFMRSLSEEEKRELLERARAALSDLSEDSE